MTESIFGIQEKALILSEKRAQLLAENMANASTPNYKARDFDFKAALENDNAVKLVKSESGPAHIEINEGKDGVQIMTRDGISNSYDGNTVDKDTERVFFMQNTLKYQSSLSFINSRVKKILSAFKEGR